MVLRARFAAHLAMASLLAAPAGAVTTLTVDLSKPIRPVTHAASGSLYGVTEMLPADVTKLIAPLKPNMFTNPAANVQQPRGDALVVAAKVAPTGARVTIRLADWFPGWPYGFTNVNDWFDKLAETVSRKKAAAEDNFYGYELWNEPDGTWKSSSLAFNDFWKQSYQKLRALDPEAKLIGPSFSYYNSSSLKSFLTFAKANDCVPDIISWHELSGGNLTSNFQNYRSLEQELGVGPLPISINEYSGKDQIDDEGQPGASAPLIAKFERFQIDTACITYWDVAHAGRLGSLLASDTATNGGWWFYKWYGDMSGSMVTTTPPSPNDAAALDGFANLDAAAHTASVLFAGVNDGSVQVVVKGFGAAAALGSKVRAVVERTPFVNRTTAVTMTSLLSSAELTVNNDQIAVDVPSTNGTDGYRLSLTSLDGGAGTPGAGGVSSSGGAGAGAGRGGAGSGGVATAGQSAGGVAGAIAATGGVGNTAGGVAVAGASTAGGAATAGAGGTGTGGSGGSSGSGGVSAAGAGAASVAGRSGNAGSASAGTNAGVSGNAGTPADSSPDGCGCRVTTQGPRSGSLLALFGLLVVRRARRSRRSTRVEPTRPD